MVMERDVEASVHHPNDEDAAQRGHAHHLVEEVLALANRVVAGAILEPPVPEVGHLHRVARQWTKEWTLIPETTLTS